jgi:hypothetical protein
MILGLRKIAEYQFEQDQVWKRATARYGVIVPTHAVYGFVVVVVLVVRTYDCLGSSVVDDHGGSHHLHGTCSKQGFG